MGRQKVIPFPITASTVIAGQSATVQPVTLCNLVLTETGGTTNETLKLYVPAPSGDNSHPAVASASGTNVGTIVVPKGTTLEIHGLDWWFPNGLYIACSGGTLAGTLGVS